MSETDKKRLTPSATPWDTIPDDELEPSQLLVARSHRSMYGFRHESFDGDVDFFNAYGRDSCPLCGSESIQKAGHARTGMQRYLCKGCLRHFTPVTGTIFENRKLPLAAWSDFLVQLFSYSSFELMTREDRRSDTTHPYWMAKLFAVLDGIQDKTVLSGLVLIDETYIPVALRDATMVDGKLLRGLSRNQMCIGVGCDAEASVFQWEGFGKTSTKKTIDTFGFRIQRGSHLTHDMERGHAGIVRELGLTESVYNSKEVCKLPDRENPLAQVNTLCFLLKRFLKAHPGFKRDNLQGFLDLFYVIANPPDNKMEKAAFVLDRAMRNPNTLRFREFYNVRTGNTL